VSSETEELYSLLIPLSEDRLIVPRACVAEVVRFTAPEHEAGAHAWMMGSVNWNGRSLPVASFEGALGKDVPVTTGRTRIVVFNATTGQLKTGYFGVLTQGFPQLVRVNEDVLQLHTTEGWPKDAPVLCRVKMINEFPLIPDLEKLEAMLSMQA
jgi:chemosensory pili system protein ChpC